MTETKEQPITPERAQEIAQTFLIIRLQLATITEEELHEFLNWLNCQESIGPLLNPNAWLDRTRFDSTVKSREAALKFLELKRVFPNDGVKP